MAYGEHQGRFPTLLHCGGKHHRQVLGVVVVVGLGVVLGGSGVAWCGGGGYQPRPLFLTGGDHP